MGVKWKRKLRQLLSKHLRFTLLTVLAIILHRSRPQLNVTSKNFKCKPFVDIWTSLARYTYKILTLINEHYENYKWSRYQKSSALSNIFSLKSKIVKVISSSFSFHPTLIFLQLLLFFSFSVISSPSSSFYFSYHSFPISLLLSSPSSFLHFLRILLSCSCSFSVFSPSSLFISTLYLFFFFDSLKIILSPYHIFTYSIPALHYYNLVWRVLVLKVIHN